MYISIESVSFNVNKYMVQSKREKMKSMDSYDSRSSLIINPFVSGEDNNAR